MSLYSLGASEKWSGPLPLARAQERVRLFRDGVVTAWEGASLGQDRVRLYRAGVGSVIVGGSGGSVENSLTSFFKTVAHIFLILIGLRTIALAVF